MGAGAGAGAEDDSNGWRRDIETTRQSRLPTFRETGGTESFWLLREMVFSGSPAWVQSVANTCPRYVFSGEI